MGKEERAAAAPTEKKKERERRERREKWRWTEGTYRVVRRGAVSRRYQGRRRMRCLRSSRAPRRAKRHSVRCSSQPCSLHSSGVLLNTSSEDKSTSSSS